jgi:hypothetical protein
MKLSGIATRSVLRFVNTHARVNAVDPHADTSDNQHHLIATKAGHAEAKAARSTVLIATFAINLPRTLAYANVVF